MSVDVESGYGLPAADAAGVHVVVNARTDVFLRTDGDDSDRVERAVRRLTEAAAAGADVLYPVGRHAPETLRRLTTELTLQSALAGRATQILARWA